MLGLLHLSLKPVLPCLASPDILNADALLKWAILLVGNEESHGCDSGRFQRWLTLQHASPERCDELPERQVVFFPFVFLCREAALVDRAIKAWICARGELVAPSVTAYANHKAIADCQIMVCR